MIDSIDYVLIGGSESQERFWQPLKLAQDDRKCLATANWRR